MTTRTVAARTRDPRIVDTLLAVGLTALSFTTVLAGAPDVGSLEPLSVGLLLFQTLPLAFRRVVPLQVFVVTTVATVAHAFLAEGPLNSSLGSLIALFTVAERCDRRTSVVAWFLLSASLTA